MSEQTKKQEGEKPEAKASAQASARPPKQKWTAKELKDRGLDPAPYGFGAKK